MKNPFSIRFHSIFFSKPMLLSITLGTILLIQPVVPLFMGTYALEVRYLYADYAWNAHAFGMFDMFAPMFVALPCSALFCNDYNSGYIKPILMRSSKKQYMISNYALSNIIGGVSIVIPLLLLSLVALLLGQGSDPVARPDYLFHECPLKAYSYTMGGFMIHILSILFGFVFGMIWSSIGLAVSTFFPNKFVALAFPMMLYYAVFLLCYNVVSLRKFTPALTILPRNHWVDSLWFTSIMQIVVFLLITALYFVGANRRLQSV